MTHVEVSGDTASCMTVFQFSPLRIWKMVTNAVPRSSKCDRGTSAPSKASLRSGVSPSLTRKPVSPSNLNRFAKSCMPSSEQMYLETSYLGRVVAGFCSKLDEMKADGCLSTRVEELLSLMVSARLWYMKRNNTPAMLVTSPRVLWSKAKSRAMDFQDLASLKTRKTRSARSADKDPALASFGIQAGPANEGGASRNSMTDRATTNASNWLKALLK